MAAAPASPVVLDFVSWETFERLLDERGEVLSPHFYYNNGYLEIMPISQAHGQPLSNVTQVVQVAAELTRRDVCSNSTITLSRKDILKACEPDAVFYFKHAAAIRGKPSLDLHKDPPPDLIVEVDITSSSGHRFPIFAGIGIAEVWRVDAAGKVTFHRLKGGAYHQIAASITVPPLTAEAVNRLLEAARHKTSFEWLQSVRKWIRAHR